MRYIPGLRAWLLAAAVLSWVSCAEEYEAAHGAAGDDGERMVIGAAVAPDGQSRSYVDEGVVKDGTYYFYYKTTSAASSYKIANVDFGDPEGPATGYAYVAADDTRRDLRWKDIYDSGKSSQSYYLCNVKPELYTVYSTSWYTFRFNSGVENPYVASPLDEQEGTNDILSGSLTDKSSMTGKRLDFKLDHALSLLKINVDVYPSEDGKYVDLTNAEVSISNLCTTVGAFCITAPASFKYDAVSNNYSTSSGAYWNVDTENPLKLVDPTDETELISWARPEESADSDGEAGEEAGQDAEDDSDGKMRFSTKRFVMPPQTIPPTSGIGRPVLTVKVPRADALGSQTEGGDEYVTYSGYIPQIMFSDTGIPEDIALRSGNQLTITATIDSPNPILLFAPVKVERWVNKGSHDFKIKQAGIYDATDIRNLIIVYQALQRCGEQDKERYLSQLEKYGYRDENNYFVFQLWANTTVDLNALTIAGTMKKTGYAPDFAFMFNGYTVTLKEDDELQTSLRGVEGQLTLYNMVTGQELAFEGIKEQAEFMALLKRLNDENSTSLAEMMQYGVLNNYDDTILFDINGTFDLELKDIYQSTPATFWGYKILFTVHSGQKVAVRFPDPNGDIVIMCEPGSYCPLSTIVPKRSTGISSAGEFYLLTECYNRYYKLDTNIELLKLFGTLSSNKWTFRFLDAMTLDGARTFLSMIPDTNAGRPEYTVTATSTVTVEDGLVPMASDSAATIYAMLSGTGKATAANSLSSIVSAYNNSSNNMVNYQTLWGYGRFDRETKTWTFPLNSSSQNITYSSLFGMMVPNATGGKYDYEFELGYTMTVKSVPNNDDLDTSSNNDRVFSQNGSTSYAYPNTAADLKKMAMGTYWDAGGADAGD